ncbi:MAG TPA: hypothetical protein VNZ26_05830 [Vicinamibacterales bacterium]|nr:hypothetical protein [Vicinamibacterales bacterium]
MTTVTFSGPVEIPGIVLPAGTYLQARRSNRWDPLGLEFRRIVETRRLRIEAAHSESGVTVR